MAIYEACVGSFIEALEAEKRGANRVELCDNLKDAGTTPSYGTIKKTLEVLTIPIMVIIRARAGDFQYSKDEIELMIEDIKISKELGVYGVVIGALKGKKIDIETTKAFIKAAEGLSITFHMAFDEIEDKYEAIDELVKLGVHRILTKGGKSDAMAGKEELKKLNQYAAGRLIIIPGKSVNKENRDYLLEYINTTEIHGTKVV